MMHRIGCLLALAAALVAVGPARGSDPVGGYLIVDKVELVPSNAPTTIQVWGSFALAARRGGNEYHSPKVGYMYFKLPSGKEAVARKEWNDLKKMAGTREVICYGSSYDLTALGTVRSAGTKADKPDVYPVGNGLVKWEGNADYKPIRELLTTPIPRAPADGAKVEAGAVSLVTGNMPGSTRPKAKYYFELVGPNGDKEEGTVEAGKKETKWAPKMKLKAGKKYTWRVRATEGTWKGPVATTTFVVKGDT